MKRILCVVALAACASDEPPARLVAVIDEPPGAVCPRGGTTVIAGNDDDGDGTLSSGEIEVRQHRCADAVVQGDLVIENSLEVGDATGVTEINGSLIIDSVVPVDLSSLVRVGGSLIVLGVDGAITAPSLAEVGGSVDIQATGASLPALRSLGYELRLDMTGGPTTVELPALTAVPAVIQLSGNLAFSAPQLARAGGLAVTSAVGQPANAVTAVALPALTTLDGALAIIGTQLATLALPALVHAQSIEIGRNPALCNSIAADIAAHVETTQVLLYDNKDC